MTDTFIKRLRFPPNFTPPTSMQYDSRLYALPLSRHCLKDDLEAVKTSADLIRRTRGGHWPESSISEDANLLDLAWHEREFKTLTSLAYAVRDADGRYTGCFYLKPVGSRTAFDSRLQNHDVDASWWVTSQAYADGHYSLLFEALRRWLQLEFPFKNPHFSNLEIPEDNLSSSTQ